MLIVPPEGWMGSVDSDVDGIVIWLMVLLRMSTKTVLKLSKTGVIIDAALKMNMMYIVMLTLIFLSIKICS